MMQPFMKQWMRINECKSQKANSCKFNAWHNENVWVHHRITQSHCSKTLLVLLQWPKSFNSFALYLTKSFPPLMHGTKTWHVLIKRVLMLLRPWKKSKKMMHAACDSFWTWFIDIENWSPPTTYPDVFAMRLCIGRLERGGIGLQPKLVVSYPLTFGT